MRFTFYWGINCGSGFAMVMIKNELSNFLALNHTAIMKLTHLVFQFIRLWAKKRLIVQASSSAKNILRPILLY